MIGSAFNTAYLGIRSNLAAFDVSAHRVAQYPFSGSIVDDVIDMKRAKHGVSANVAVLRASSEMSNQLVDIIV